MTCQYQFKKGPNKGLKCSAICPGDLCTQHKYIMSRDPEKQKINSVAYYQKNKAVIAKKYRDKCPVVIKDNEHTKQNYIKYKEYFKRAARERYYKLKLKNIN